MNGLSPAEATGRRVAAEWQPVAIYTSPLSRSVKTAEAIAKHFGCPVQLHPGLADIDYGNGRVLSPEEARQRWQMRSMPGTTVRSRRASLGRDPGRSTARAMQTVNELADRHPGETIVLVGHTVINRIVLLGVLGLGNERFWRIKPGTPAPSRLRS